MGDIEDLGKYLTLTTLESALPLSLLILGVWIVYGLLNDFDLTVQGTFPLGAAVTAVLLVDHVNPFVSTAAAVAVGCLAGAVTAAIHMFLRISLLLAGIVSMTALYTVNLRVMGQPNLELLSEQTIFGPIDQLSGDMRTTAVIAVFLVIVLIVFLAVIYFLQTELGLALRATGVNRLMARSVGVNSNFVVFLALVMSNGFVALGGSLLAQDEGFADVQLGDGQILAAVAAILLGSLVIRARSHVARAVASVALGSLIYQLILVGALRLGLEPYDLKGFTAIILIAVIGSQRLRDLKREFPNETSPGALARMLLLRRS